MDTPNGPGNDDTKSDYQKLQLTLVDPRTGDIIDDGVPVLQRRKRRYYNEDYALMFQEALKTVSMNRVLTGDALRVWLYLVGSMEMRNWIPIQQKQIAAALGIHKTHISTYFKKLIEVGYLEKGTRIGKSTLYRIPIDFTWKGPGNEYQKEKHLKIVRDNRERMKLSDSE